MKLVMVRGDHRVNEIKLRNALKSSRSAPARPDEIEQRLGPPGYIRSGRRPQRADPARRGRSRRTGTAGQLRDSARKRAPTRTCAASSPASRLQVRTRRRAQCGRRRHGQRQRPIRIEPAIEVGNIFKLGVRYSEPLGATYLDENGTIRPMWMGSYGFGPARAAAAAVEQYADAHGISWPRAISPFDVELVVLGKPGSDERALADGVVRRAAGDRPRRSCTTTATPDRARSSPTPSCSAARCA